VNFVGEAIASHFPVLFLLSFVGFLTFLLSILGCDGIAALWHGSWKQKVLSVPRLFGAFRKPWAIAVVALLATSLSFFFAILAFKTFVLPD